MKQDFTGTLMKVQTLNMLQEIYTVKMLICINDMYCSESVIKLN
jgi:hypothetical protein